MIVPSTSSPQSLATSAPAFGVVVAAFEGSGFDSELAFEPATVAFPVAVPAGGSPLPLSRQTKKYCNSPGGPVKLVVSRHAPRRGTSRATASSHIHRPTKRSHASTCAHSSVTKLGFSSMDWNPRRGPSTEPSAHDQGGMEGSNTWPNLAASSSAPGWLKPT